MTVGIPRLREAVEYAQGQLGSGLLVFDIFDAATGLGLVTHNPNPAADALFSMLHHTMDKAFIDSGRLPEVGEYYLLRLSGNRLAVVISPDESVRGLMLVDAQTAPLGVVLSVIVPTILMMCQEGAA